MIRLKRLKVEDPGLFLRIIRLKDLDRITLSRAQEITYRGSKILARNDSDVNKKIFKYSGIVIENFVNYATILRDLELAFLYNIHLDLGKIYDHYLQELQSFYFRYKAKLNESVVKCEFDDRETLMILALSLLVHMKKIEFIEVVEMVTSIRDEGLGEEDCIKNMRSTRVAKILNSLR